jgi:predicted anti-sigma-YlaC factor YlaD
MRFTRLRAMPMIGCRRAQQRLSEYLDGELGAGELRCVAMHVDHCRMCRAALHTLAAVVEMLGHLPDDDPVGGGVTEAVERRLAGES